MFELNVVIFSSYTYLLVYISTAWSIASDWTTASMKIAGGSDMQSVSYLLMMQHRLMQESQSWTRIQTNRT